MTAGLKHQVKGLTMAEMQATGHTGASAAGAARARIAARDATIHAIAALNDATAALPPPGARGDLAGIPVLIKDNIDVAGMATTAGSWVLKGNLAAQDAPVTANLRRAGALILGKTTMHEWASGITSVSSLHGATRNAIDARYVAGGSSGGSAAAVAAGYVAGAIGTDTAGSIRIPAAFHGLYGLRPTAGTMEMDGIVPLSPTQDIAGPIAATPEDVARLLAAMTSGNTSLARLPEQIARDALRGARIGVPPGLFGETASERAVTDACRLSLSRMQAAGAELVPVDAAGLEAQASAASVVDHEFRPALAAYLEQRAGIGLRDLQQVIAAGHVAPALEQVLRRRLAAAGLGSPEHLLALQRRAALIDRLQRLFDGLGLSVLAYPTMRQEPALLGGAQAGQENVNISACSGFPAITCPAGWGTSGLPVGIEFLGLPGAETLLLSLAAHWHRIVTDDE